MHSGSGENQDVELVASGLINEVSSAATQVGPGATRCQVTEHSHPQVQRHDAGRDYAPMRVLCMFVCFFLKR